MARSLPLAAYLALASVAGGAGAAAGARPEGPLLWVHADDPARAPVVAALAERLARAGPATTLLTLTPRGGTRRAPGGTGPGQGVGQGAGPDAGPFLGQAPGQALGGRGPMLTQAAPPEGRGSVRAFLDHWRPDLLLWIGGNLRPALIAGGGMPKLLIEGAPEARLLSHGRWIPGLARAVVPIFDRALVTGAEAAQRLRRAGLPEARLRVAPPLDAAPPILSCNERERRDVAQTIGARPVWLAGDVPLSELGAVAGAQLRAMRGAHRLLLILAPRVPDEAPAFARGLTEAGLRVAVRADGAEPHDEAQVYLADGTSEMGLWLRLAPVAFVGGTLAGGAGGPGGRHPFEGAALGSALLHGPRTAPHDEAWARLHAASAARLVRNGQELGQAVETLLVPDRAAAMAHGAWDVATQGSEVANLVEGLIRERIDALPGADGAPGGTAASAWASG